MCLLLGVPWGAASAELRPTSWIAAPGGPERDWNVVHFRKEVTLDTVPAHLLVNVSADARFVLEVNGQRMGAGPAYSDLHHWRYEVVDLAGAMHAGRNDLVATVWRFGSAGPVAQMGSSTAFLLYAVDRRNGYLNTSLEHGWEVRRDPGRTEAQSHLPGYHAAGPGERMDGHAMVWDMAGEEGWSKPVSRGPAARREALDSGNDWMLEEDPLPAMTYTPTEAGRVVRATEERDAGAPAAERTDLMQVQLGDKPLEVEAHRHLVLLLDRGALTTAYPQVVLSGGDDAALKVTYAEALYDADNRKGDRNEVAGRHIAGQTDEILAEGGQRRSYAPLWWRTWRYLQLDIRTGDKPLRLDGVKAFETRYPFQAVGRFASSDPELARIWDVGWRTAQLCAHETYMDTPYWEQLQYVGDTRIQALITYAVSGDDRLPRQALEAYSNSLMPDGLTQSRYPSALTQVIPPFSLLWVGMLRDSGSTGETRRLRDRCCRARAGCWTGLRRTSVRTGC